MAIMSAGGLRGDKVWINNPSIVDGGPYAPVINENLYIEGVNRIYDHVHIVASSADVLVSVTGADSVVSTTDFVLPGELHIFADAGRTVTFDLGFDLMFRGSSQDMLITFSGGGNLIFNVHDTANISFSSLPTEHGAKFLVNSDNFVHSPGAYSVLFKRDANSDALCYVTIGSKGMVSYIAPAGSTGQSGLIQFDASNSTANSGRLILEIQDGGSLDIQAHLNNAGVGQGFGDITLADIDLTSVEGGNSTAQFSVVNSDPGTDWSGLLVVNSNTQWSRLESNPWCELSPTGTHVGFVLGQNGLLQTNDFSYLDYVGTVTNYTFVPATDPAVLEARELEGFPSFNYTKDRNPSALIVDGASTFSAVPQAQIIMDGKSAIYFRSGVDQDGLSTFTVYDPLVRDTVISFTISPADTQHGYAGYGEIVFDVEGPLTVRGSQDTGGENVLNILSLFVSPTGGSVFIESPDTVFPLRTYERDGNGQYLQYNTACFMINNRVNMHYASLQHTDTLHLIFDKNFPKQSEASYIGGETWKLCDDRPRPTVALYNSQFLLHTSAAATGVDFLTPEDVSTDVGNNSFFKFYYNGRCYDQGTGRELVLGTEIGALASDLNTIINRDSHLDSYQETSQDPAQPQVVNLEVFPNNNKVVEGLPANGADIAGQFSVQTIYLGWGSNITLGTNADFGIDPVTTQTFALTTLPTLFIDGDFFTFQTQGGDISEPELSMSTGQGGIFVDTNGIITIDPTKRASFGTMITKSHNGIIDLPKRQIFFAPGIGIAQWRLDLSQPSQLEIVGAGQILSDYTLDWSNVTKDYCNTATPFVPYEPNGTPAACQCPPVVNDNLINLPIIRGIIDQFQVINSRLGDQVNLLIDGGLVRELVMLNSNISGAAPVGFIVLQNDANLGLGTAHRNIDSDEAQVVLGVNGIMLCANGNAQVVLNEDTLINNACPILTGTAFGITEKDQLYFTSVVPRELRVKNTGFLDLTDFANDNQEIIIGGDITLVFEPGARLMMGGGKFRLADNAKIVFEPFIDADFPAGTDLTWSDPFRVKWSGTGNFIMSEDSQMLIMRGAFVGLESGGIAANVDEVIDCSFVTSQTWTMRDAAKIYIGSDTDFGGAFQIGNTTNLTEFGAAIDWTLQLNGPGVLVDVNSQGLLGLGVGVVNKPEDVIDTWTVDRTFNVNNITITLTQGTFRNAQIFPTSNKIAGLLALGSSVGQYGFTFDQYNVDILGGGNMVLINGGPVTPTVANVNGVINADLTVGLLSSTAVLLDTSKVGLLVNPFTASTLFNYLALNDYQQQSEKLATIAQYTLGSPTAGYINNGVIFRQSQQLRIFNESGFTADPQRSVELGYVGIAIDENTQVPTYTEVVI